MKATTPESMGVRSSDILAYVKFLESRHYAMHSIIVARGDNIVFEHYTPSFGKDIPHRLYSVTKSFVSLAIGFCIQDGLLSLGDNMKKLFPKETAGITDRNILNQTVRDMLMMKTSKTNVSWFLSGCTDRVDHYFKNNINSRPRPKLLGIRQHRFLCSRHTCRKTYLHGALRA